MKKKNKPRPKILSQDVSEIPIFILRSIKVSLLFFLGCAFFAFIKASIDENNKKKKNEICELKDLIDESKISHDFFIAESLEHDQVFTQTANTSILPNAQTCPIQDSSQIFLFGINGLTKSEIDKIKSENIHIFVVTKQNPIVGFERFLFIVLELDGFFDKEDVKKERINTDWIGKKKYKAIKCIIGKESKNLEKIITQKEIVFCTEDNLKTKKEKLNNIRFLDVTEENINKINGFFPIEESKENVFFSFFSNFYNCLINNIKEGSYIWATLMGIIIFLEFLDQKSSLFQLETKTIPKEKRIFFKDIGGLQQAKEELKEVVDFFKNPDAYKSLGINLPKGILLEGPPGNGKTMLARALAGECGVLFLFCAGSELDHLFVGVGAQRIRELFAKAKQHPIGSIIFIDEIDCIASKRNSNSDITQHHHTLYQLLVELDGFEQNDKVVVLASTNMKKILDPAILRPGRFDKHIRIGYPNKQAKKEIVELCVKKLGKFKFNLSVEEIVNIICDLSINISGADIQNIFNEAAVITVRKRSLIIETATIVEALEKNIFGVSGIKPIKSKREIKISSYHEAGHALIAMSLPKTFVRRVTIVSYTEELGGYTLTGIRREDDDEDDNRSHSRKEILSLIKVMLGGRIGEEVLLGKNEATSGAAHDFEKISYYLRNYIYAFGMTELGILPFEHKDLFGRSSRAHPDLPQSVLEQIESVRRKILEESTFEVRKIIFRNIKKMHIISETLTKKGCILKKEMDFIFITGLPLDLYLLK